MGRGKKFLSLFLAVAMTVTGINVGMPVTAQAAEKAEETAAMPEKLAYFSFDELVGGNADGTVMVSGDDVGQTVTATPTGTGVSIDTADKRIGDGALRLQSNSFMTVMGGKDNLLVGKTKLTFSFWYKTANTNTNWAFYASKDNGGSTDFGGEHYIGMLLKSGAEFERYYQGRGYASLNVGTVNNRTWNHLTVVMDERSSQVYLNGQLRVSRDGAPLLTNILSEGSKLQLGKANWGNGEYYNGWLDEFAIYDGALTDAQVKEEYDNFFEPVTVNFKCGDTVLATRTERWYNEAEDTYTYVLQDADKEIVNGTDVYVRAGEQTLTTDKQTKEINVIYNAATVKDVVGTYAAETRIGVAPTLPEKVTASLNGTDITIEIPVTWDPVPESAYAEKGTYEVEGTALGKKATLTLTTKDKEELLLAHYSFDKGDGLTDEVNADRKAQIKGSKPESVQMKRGLAGNAVYFTEGATAKNVGYIELPDNLLKKGDNTANERNITISLFAERDITVNSFAMSLLTAPANSKGESTDYIGLIDHNACRAEWRRNNSNIGVASADPAVRDRWYHYAITIDSDAHVMNLYRDGHFVKSATNPNMDIANFTADNLKNYLGYTTWGDNDFKGAIDEFKIYDTVLTLEEIQALCNENLHGPQLDRAKKSLEDAFEEGAFFAGNDSAESVTENLNLPQEVDEVDVLLEWTSSDETYVQTDGTVKRPSVLGGEQEVTLTATLTIENCTEEPRVFEFTVKVQPYGGASFDGLRNAITEAQAAISTAQDLDIYTTGSINRLMTAIAAAQEVAKIEDEEHEYEIEEIRALQNRINDAEATLREATATMLELKDLEELDKTKMVGWYPLTENAENVLEDGGNGTTRYEVTYDRMNGATFEGQSALYQAIQIPTDFYTITDTMTISFWAKDEAGVEPKQNVIGFGSGTKHQSYQSGTAAHFFYVNTNEGTDSETGKPLMQVGMRTNSWQGGKNVTTVSNVNDWQHIVCVFEGKKLTLYVDGEQRLVEEDMGADLTEVWYADPANRHFYIGNCSYAGNDDKDYSGKVKDVRIYDTAIAAEQVRMIKKYMDDRPMQYAKDDLIAKLNSHVLGNKNRVNITRHYIDLPTTGVQDEEIKWTVSPDDGNVIDLNTGTVEFPDEDNPFVYLTATITLKDGTEDTIEFECLVAEPLEDVDTTELEALLEEIGTLDERDYLPAAWAKYLAAKEEAMDAVILSKTQAEADAAKANLQKAYNELIGNLRGDKTQLLQVIQQANLLMESTALPYPQDARDALQRAIRAARSVRTNANATQDEVDQAVTDLQAAIETFEATVGPELRPAGEEDMDDLASMIQDAKDAIDTSKYTDLEIAKLREAIDAAEALAEQDNLTQQNILDAIEALQDAVDALEESAEEAKDTERLVLTTAIATAEARDISAYTEVSQKAYKDAVAKIKAADKDGVTKGEVDKALAELQDALDELEATATPVTEADRGELSIAILRASRSDMDDYPQSAINEYTKKLNDLRTVALKTNLTKGDIAQALADLDAATAALEATRGHKDPADMTALNKSIADAEKLNEKDYTAASWKTFKDALDAAKTVAAKTDATQTEVDDAKKALDDASGKLDKVKVTTQKKTLVVGETLKITKSGYSYVSAKKNIATVSNKGVVTAKKNGTVVVTATSNDQKTVIKYTITVKKAPGKIAKVTYKNGKKTVTIKLTKNKGTVTLKKGKSITLTPVLPKNTFSKFKYTLSGKNAKKLASVSAKGVVKAKKKGTVTVKIQTLNKKSVTITVKIK